MESSLQASSPCGDSRFPCINSNEHLLKQRLLFAGDLKNLKDLRSQLYSAAECFESNYAKRTLKEEPQQMVRDYVVQALVNTVDHLGFVSSKITEQIDKEAAIITRVELRVSCMEQRTQACRALLDRDVFRYPTSCDATHHKHYLLQEGKLSADKAVPGPVEMIPRERLVLKPLTENVLSSSTRSRTSSFRNIFSSSSFRWGRSSPKKSRPLFLFPPESTQFPESAASSTAPSPISDLSLRSVSFSSPRALIGSSTRWFRKQEGLRNAPGQSFRGGYGEWDEVTQSPSRSKRILENFMGRRKASVDQWEFNVLRK